MEGRVTIVHRDRDLVATSLFKLPLILVQRSSMAADHGSTVPFPPSGGYLQAVRDSSRSCGERAEIQVGVNIF